MGRARDAGPAPHPRAVRGARSRLPGCASPRACTSPPRRRTWSEPSRPAARTWSLCASNPLSTQDDVAAALVAEYGISDLRPPRRRPRHLLRPSQRRGGHSPADDDGRRLRSGDAHPPGAPRPAGRHRGRHRGDDNGRHPAAGDGGRRRARLPGRGGERGADEASLRQSLRDRPVDAGRRSCGRPIC